MTTALAANRVSSEAAASSRSSSSAHARKTSFRRMEWWGRSRTPYDLGTRGATKSQ